MHYNTLERQLVFRVWPLVFSFDGNCISFAIHHKVSNIFFYLGKTTIWVVDDIHKDDEFVSPLLSMPT